MGQRQLFGTDGIRGKANIYPMTCEVAMQLGRAVTHYFRTKYNRNKSPLIVLGKDTRRSCYMLEQAFSAGVCSQGGRVILTGPLPTPGVAFVAKSMRADAGVVISASHNSYEDNGIKIFNGDGYKLPDAVELELEKMILDPTLVPSVVGPELGRAMRLDESQGRYNVHVKSTFPANYNLEGMRLVLDCANGASYKIAPQVFTELGAEVVSIGVDPNGVNINEGCGSLYPKSCQEEVKTYRADLGLCFDGDADRIVVVDANGAIIEGDALIGLFAKLLVDQGELVPGDCVVGTVMSNLGLENYLRGIGLDFFRAKVGDRYIMDHMHDNPKAKLGGEPSGHIIFRKYSTTGDGVQAGLKVIEAIKYYKQPLHELIKGIKLYPQVLKNIEIKNKLPLDSNQKIQDGIKWAASELKDKGRTLLRYSGTENKLRIMVEGENEKKINEICNKLIEICSEALG